MYSKKTKEQKGITLVALVITIIVLLILAGVTINLTLGERGIFSTAQKAVENYKTAQEKELTGLNNFEDEISNVINGLGSSSTSTTPPITYIEYTVGQEVIVGETSYYVMKASGASEAYVTLLRKDSYGSYTWEQAKTEGTNYASSLGYTSTQATSHLITFEEAKVLSSSMRTTGSEYWTSSANRDDAWYADYRGWANYNDPGNTFGARPVLVILKSLI